MSLAEQFRGMAAELDELVYKQDFPAAADCVVRIAELVRDAGREHPPDEAVPLVAESLRMIETARRKICASRARLQECKQRLERTAEYCVGRPATPHTWSLEG